MKIIQNSLLLLLLLAFALAGPMETSQAEKGISSTHAAPETAEPPERFINLIPYDRKDAIQVPFETVKKFKSLTGEDDDIKESEIKLPKIDSETLELVVKYASRTRDKFSPGNPSDIIRYLLYNIGIILEAITFCSIKH